MNLPINNTKIFEVVATSIPLDTISQVDCPFYVGGM